MSTEAKKIRITIDEQVIELDTAITVLKAARRNGIRIPHFCHHPLLHMWGGCRICVVEVEKVPRLQNACTLMVADGMVIRTESDAISEARKSILEFILANHPLDCPTCDKAGECKLQDYAVLFGPETGNFKEKKRTVPEVSTDPLIVRNMERCVMCTRCARFCDEVQGASALGVIQRGKHATIQPFCGDKFDCEYCGNCITMCPVGALMSKLHRYCYRPWQVEKDELTVCSYCGVGCTFRVQSREGKIMRVAPKKWIGVNRGLLCGRGRFGYEYVGSQERLTTPLVRKDGRLVESSWEEALDFAAKKLSEIKEKHGGDSIALVGSGRCTNEENYLLQKFARAAVGTNNIDTAASLGTAALRRLYDAMLGRGSTAHNIIDISNNSDCVVVAGGDPTKVNPVMGLQVRRAYRHHARVFTLGTAQGLRLHQTLNASFGEKDTAFLKALVASLNDKKTEMGKQKDLAKVLKDTELIAPGAIDESMRSTIESMAADICNSLAVSIVVGREILNYPDGMLRAALIGALAYVCGARIFIMTEKPNEQGLLDVGASPDVFPGEIPVTDAACADKLKEVWQVEALSQTPGLSLMEIFEQAGNGKIKALYVMGENPVFNLPDGPRVLEGIKKAELVIVQDIFLTETASEADVVFPAAAWTEKAGSYTNLERTIQCFGKINPPPGEAREDLEIIADLSGRLGYEMSHKGAEDVFKEIASVVSVYEGLDYSRMRNNENAWPYGNKPSDAPFKAPGLQNAEGAREAVNGPVEVVVEKPLLHSGTLSRHSRALNSVHSEPKARMCPNTAIGLKVDDGDMVEITSDKGTLRLKVSVDFFAPEGKVFVTNNFAGSGSLGIMGYTMLPGPKTPVVDTAGLGIKKADS